MNNIEIEIWNRKLNLEIYYETFGKATKENQIKLADKLINVKNDIDRALTEMCIYIEKKYGENLPNGKIDNIFKYVMPKTIYIPDSCDFSAILCDFKFDIEGGLAIVFEDEKISIKGQDEIL